LKKISTVPQKSQETATSSDWSGTNLDRCSAIGLIQLFTQNYTCTFHLFLRLFCSGVLLFWVWEF
jgi:hypothetical protein